MSAIGTEPIAEKARRLLAPIAAAEGYELVDVEWLREGGRWVLRIFVDRPGGVGIEDCQALSRIFEPALDVEDFIEPAWALEVSSPGVERPLRTPEHFARFAGERVAVKAFGPIDTGAGPRRTWTGTLRGFEEGCVLVEAEGRIHRIPREKVARAHVAYDFEADLRRKE